MLFLRWNKKSKGRVLYVGHLYYYTWYLSRALRRIGWKADSLNIDPNPDSKMYYHGEDYFLEHSDPDVLLRKQIWFYITALFRYDIFHFCNAHAMTFFGELHSYLIKKGFPAYSEIRLLKKFGKKIVYSNNSCLDGVSQTSFRSWDPEPVCDICIWQDQPDVCSDERNLAWGKVRNELADFQCTLGGNRKDYNDDPHVHEVPEFYCLDSDFWRPDLPIPEKSRMDKPPGKVIIYHAVGNYKLRTKRSGQQNIKSTHIYIPLIQQLKMEGYPVELFFAKNIPNKEVRFFQAQADIVVDMLTFGFFGANIREAMMLGKPAVCYLRPEWLESMRKEIPEYVGELPVISATPATIHEVLVDLITHPNKRIEIGRKSREFAVKWHSKEAGAKRLNKIYSDLLAGRSNLVLKEN